MELNIKISSAFILMLFLARLGEGQSPARAVFDVTKYGATPNGDISKVCKSCILTIIYLAFGSS